jgi:hypothetical protein
MLGA